MDTIDPLRLSALRLLVLVAETGNFAAAGRRAGLSRAVVSKTVARLEDELGVRMFQRTTRQVVLSDAGRRLVEELGPVLDRLERALLAARAERDSLAGPVRISASHAFARVCVVPSLAAFGARYPEVRVELRMTDVIEDLVSSAVDFAVRLGPLPDAELRAVRLGRVPLVLAATPVLAGRAAAPRTPEELCAWPAVGFRIPGASDGAIVPWRLRHRGGERLVQPEDVRVVTDSIEGAADLVRQGCGVGLLPRYLVEDELASGALLSFFEARLAPGPEVHLCFVERRLLPRRVRLLMDHLGADLRGFLRRSR